MKPEELIGHVGCGSLDNYGMCKKCDAIRDILQRMIDKR